MRTGLVQGLSAYVLWALFPLYFKLLTSSGTFEIIAYRVLCSLAFYLVFMSVVGGWPDIRRLLSTKRLLWSLALAGLLVTGNWTIYVVGVNSGHTLDAALGYFINPLVAAGLGVLVLGEKLNRLQWGAFLVGAIACVVITLGIGRVPWIAFGVALTFGFYGLIKKQVGGEVPAVAGMAVETAALAPVLAGYLVWLGATGGSTVPPGSGYSWVMYASGPITAVPLLLFAASARRLPLVTLGMIQYIAPIGQFLLGWLVFHEAMPPGRWVGFGLVWLAVLMFLASAVLQARRRLQRS